VFTKSDDEPGGVGHVCALMDTPWIEGYAMSDPRTRGCLTTARRHPAPYPPQTCSETSSVFIIRPTAQRYGALVIMTLPPVEHEADRVHG
jgi:hypothetical protein